LLGLRQVTGLFAAIALTGLRNKVGQFIEDEGMLKTFKSFQYFNMATPWLSQSVIRIVIILGLVALFGKHLPDTYFFDDKASYMPLHTALEFFAIAVGMLIFATVWHTRDKQKDGRSLFLASMFLGVAMLDFLHAMSFFGMPDFITPNVPGKAISFWFAGRLMAVAGLLGAVLFSFTVLQKSYGLLVLLASIVFLVCLTAWAQFYHPELFPVFFVSGIGLTATKVNVEYIIAALCLITASIMFYKSEQASNRYWVYLGSAALMMMFSEFYFTLYDRVTDVYNLFGHLYKIIAYSMIYQAVFVSSVREPYEQVKQLQKKQEEMTELLISAQKIAHLGQWELEFPSHRLSWSAGIYDLFEIDPKKFGANYEAFLALCHPEDRHQINEIFSTSVRDHTPYEYLHRLLMQDGRVKWVKESGFTIFDHSGVPVCSKGTVIEVTDIVKMEASLRESEKHYRTITESLPVPLAINDQKGNITFLNHSFVQTFGYDPADISTLEDWWPLAYPDPVYRDMIIQEWGKQLEQMAQGRAFVAMDIDIKCKNGDIKSVLGSAVPLNEKEHLVFLYDITDRRKIENESQRLREQLAQAGKMEAIGQLTAGIAHDFNNILGAIMGYTELSQHMLTVGNPGPVTRYQEEIINASTRAKDLISQMLTFSRLTPGGQDRIAPVIALSPLVKEVSTLLRSSIPSGIGLDCHLNEDIAARILPVHLHQIILNLSINARDALGDQGSIDISVDQLQGVNLLCTSCSTVFSGDYARIMVKDNGNGIAEDLLNKIFDPFFTTKEIGKGTGMGLSVVHGLVHSQGGHIQVHSQVGKGTDISVLLPLATLDLSTQDKNNTSQLLNLEGLKIMLVDDEQAITTMLHEFISAYGMHVVSFTNPTRALEEFSRLADNIDLLITDETMPGMSGMQLTEAVMKIKPGIPVILCTGHSDRATPEAAAAKGIAGFFYKPVNMNELLEKIQSLTRDFN